MGLDPNGIRFLLWAQKSGVDLTKSAMIGRQSLHVSAAMLRHLLRLYGHSVSQAQAGEMLEQEHGFADPLLRRLGAKEVVSFDHSAYEAATYVHDFNEPLPRGLDQTCTAVLDGGSLEHVFNFPVAIQNCMRLVRQGGHYLAVTPANNLCGHGFYQFSPELYFRVFSRENGFAVEKMILFEPRPLARWYEVFDPEQIGRRIELDLARPAYLLVMARKLSSPALGFAKAPVQSDYTRVWTDSARAASGGTPQRSTLPSGWAAALKRRIPFRLKLWVWATLSSRGLRLPEAGFREMTDY